MDSSQNQETNTGGGAAIGRDVNAEGNVIGRDSIHIGTANIYHSSEQPTVKTSKGEVLPQQNLYSLLTDIYLRSPDIPKRKVNRKKLENSEFTDILEIIMPKPLLNQYEDCIEKQYSIHTLIAHLLYFIWRERGMEVDQAKLEEAVRLKLRTL